MYSLFSVLEPWNSFYISLLFCWNNNGVGSF